MLIGEISSKTQLSRDTIRFYEKRGLIKVPQSKSLNNNYKNYSDENLQQLLLIKKAKQFGFTLNEISELLYLSQTNQANCSLLREKIVQKIEDIDMKIKGLQEMKSGILTQLNMATNMCSASQEDENCTILN